MNELNRDQIIKALECCINDECDKCGVPFGNCQANLMQDALALIKELIEENERLEKYLDDHFPKCIYQYNGDVQEYCVLGPCGQFKTVAEFQKQIEADTVREMKERLEMKFGTYVLGYKIPLTEALEFVNQIAKEMLEGEK